MLDPKGSLDHLGDPAKQFTYQEQIDEVEEKFRLWKTRTLLEKKNQFGKIRMFDGIRRDSLSQLIAVEMNLLLIKSEIDCHI